MSSTPLPEFEVENIKIEEPETTEGLTGTKFVYTLRSCPMGKLEFERLIAVTTMCLEWLQVLARLAGFGRLSSDSWPISRANRKIGSAWIPSLTI